MKKEENKSKLLSCGLFARLPDCSKPRNRKKDFDFESDFTKDFSSCEYVVPVPLKSIVLRFHVVESVAVFKIAQTYQNSNRDVVLDVSYCFPISEKAAIYSVNVVFQDGRKLIGEIKRKEDATKEFEENVKEGHFAVQVDYEYSEMLRFQLGNLLPVETIQIEVQYAVEVSKTNDQFQLIIPTYISPRYSSNSFPVIESEMKTIPDINYVWTPNAAQPKGYSLTVEGYLCANEKLVGIHVPSHPSLKLNVEENSHLSNHRHTPKMELQEIKKEKHKEKKVTPSSQLYVESKKVTELTESLAVLDLTYKITGLNKIALDRDVIISWTTLSQQQKQPQTPKLYLEGPLMLMQSNDREQKKKTTKNKKVTFSKANDSSNQTWCAMLSFSTLSEREENPILKAEYILVLDRSGSMQNERIELAKRALLLFLKSLPMGSFFNVLSFGSSMTLLFPQSVPYTNSYVNQATLLIEKMTADLGGTELRLPLEAVFSSDQLPRVSSSPLSLLLLEQEETKTKTKKAKKERKENPKDNLFMSRQVLLLTDGDVFDTFELVKLVSQLQKKEKAQNLIPCRLFTLGIGQSSNKNLIRSLANAGHGTWRSVSDDLSDMNKKVIELLRLSQSSAVEEVTVEWQFNGSAVESSSLAPANLSSFFDSTQYNLFAFLPFRQDSVELQKGSVTFVIHERNAKQELRFSKFVVPFTFLPRDFNFPSESPSQSPSQSGSKSERETTDKQPPDRFFHQLATAILIADPSLSQERKVELSLRNHTLSPYTSFILVDKTVRAKGLKTQKINIPVYNSTPSSSQHTFRSYASPPPPSGAKFKRLGFARKKEGSFVLKPDILAFLVGAQAVEGYFEKDKIPQELYSEMKNQKQVKEEQKKFAGFLGKLDQNPNVFATILVLLFLQYNTSLYSRKDEWEPMAKKAQRWISNLKGPQVLSTSISKSSEASTSPLLVQEELEEEIQYLPTFLPNQRNVKFQITKLASNSNSSHLKRKVASFRADFMKDIVKGIYPTVEIFSSYLGMKKTRENSTTTAAYQFDHSQRIFPSFLRFPKSISLFLLKDSHAGMMFDLEIKHDQNQKQDLGLHVSGKQKNETNPNYFVKRKPKNHSFLVPFGTSEKKDLKLWLWSLEKEKKKPEQTQPPTPKLARNQVVSRSSLFQSQRLWFDEREKALSTVALKWNFCNGKKDKSTFYLVPIAVELSLY